MAGVTLSEAEKTFVLHSVQQDLRIDGRSRTHLRPLVIETDVVTHANGSARIRLANTEVLVAVKAELEATQPHAPSQGRIEFFVDCSANAAPAFEGRGGEDLATAVAGMLAKAYGASHLAFDLKQLLVLDGVRCWALFVDVLVLECGGNLFDAVALGAKCALFNARLPKVKVTAVDGGVPELDISDDPFDGQRLDAASLPLLVTLTRIGNHCVLDPTPEEEACASASVVVGVTPKGKVTAVNTLGSGSFHCETLTEAVTLAAQVGAEINASLDGKLRAEENLTRNKTKSGFLR